jgi:hypothetical protein
MVIEMAGVVAIGHRVVTTMKEEVIRREVCGSAKFHITLPSL